MINTRRITTVIGTIATAFCLICTTGQAAHAGVLHNDWNYALDSTDDAFDGPTWETYGMAVKEDGNKFYVVLNGKFGQYGTHDEPPLPEDLEQVPVDDAHYQWGDLFFNFSGLSFSEASQNGSLYAINFSDLDHTPNGVYANVIPTKLSRPIYPPDGIPTGQNPTELYEATYADVNPGTDGRKNMGDLVATDPYFGQPNDLIKYAFEPNQAQRIGDITLLDQYTAWADLGLDVSLFGSQDSDVKTFGFSFDRNLLPAGSFIAHIFSNCGNDGVALANGVVKSTPEPSSMIGMAALGLAFAGNQLYKRRQQSK